MTQRTASAALLSAGTRSSTARDMAGEKPERISLSIRLDWIGFCFDEPSQARVLKRSSIMSLSAESSTATLAPSWWTTGGWDGTESSQAGRLARVRMGAGALKRCTGTWIGSARAETCGRRGSG